MTPIFHHWLTAFCRAARGRYTPRNSWPRCVRPVSHTTTTTSSAPAASTRPRKPMPRARAPRSALLLELWPQLVCSRLRLAHTLAVASAAWASRVACSDAWHPCRHGMRPSADPHLPVLTSISVELVCGLLRMRSVAVGRPVEHAGPEFLMSHDKGLTLIVCIARAAPRGTVGLARARADRARRFMVESACIVQRRSREKSVNRWHVFRLL